MTTKGIGTGLVAVVAMFGAAGLLVLVLFEWLDWCMNLKSEFWAMALSPMAALGIFFSVLIFRFAAESDGGEGNHD